MFEFKKSTAGVVKEEFECECCGTLDGQATTDCGCGSMPTNSQASTGCGCGSMPTNSQAPTDCGCGSMPVTNYAGCECCDTPVDNTKPSTNSGCSCSCS